MDKRKNKLLSPQLTKATYEKLEAFLAENPNPWEVSKNLRKKEERAWRNYQKAQEERENYETLEEWDSFQEAFQQFYNELDSSSLDSIILSSFLLDCY